MRALPLFFYRLRRRSLFVIEKNQKMNIQIISLSSDGQGIGKVDGFTIFVKGALPDEIVKIHIIKVKKSYAIANLEEIIKASPDRIMPSCDVFGRCGGCGLQHVSYDKQLEYKHEWTISALQRISGIEDAKDRVRPVIEMDVPWRYRNKASFPVQENPNKQVQFGFYALRSHRLVATEDCPLQETAIIEAMRIIQDWVNHYGVKAYNELDRTGVLRHVVIRKGNYASEGMVIVLVTKTKQIGNANNIDSLVQQLQSQQIELGGLLHNVQPEPDNVIMGEEMHVLYGDSMVEEEIDGLLFDVSAQSFMQVNSKQTNFLYAEAVNAAQLTGDEIVIDAYCGVGTMSLLLAQKAKQVYGVEIVASTIEDANKNATKNKIQNVEFIADAAEVFLPRWAAEGHECDVLVLDPPRRGCQKELLEAALKLKPKRIVYVSCDIATLARDVQILLEGKQYQLSYTQPVDMFAQTVNLESVTLLERID